MFFPSQILFISSPLITIQLMFFISPFLSNKQKTRNANPQKRKSE